ncbi:glycosyl transferase [Nocardioides psychrotolerans]|uniref:Glycosyltransferase involved in cell wall bisynthesis n=1 Tax=Nocardioides psychrotolerans TaxID=1005945 RepID=A0A1I3N5S0_9ACTN|nr:glycosyltransferase family 4 protein [Nocardioides psychrotolerans]GEP40449.1 glycosyl transferase [Nocardioides psychrotolerans]SFJ04608.1 Glycosyltransferase involved in cell wall bisynthesis [Nocardioides psychrotolerans]
MAPPSRPSLRIASFGFRSLPPREGSAGADKFAVELLPRLAARGHRVVAYNRGYFGEARIAPHDFRGVTVRTIRTFRRSGLEALWHSLRVAVDIIAFNRADVVHMQNGGNSPFGLLLRVFGKRTVLTEDGLEWERDKWSALGKLYLRATTALTGRVHSAVAFDNVFAKEYFEERFGKQYDLIAYGSDVDYDASGLEVLDRLGLEPGGYFLFVGRFIPDKGLHYLVPAFERLDTKKQLVMVGGSKPRSEYEDGLRETTDPRILMPGYLYGPEVHALMSNCYAYVQPSDLEGLSPVILESSFLGAPIICSDIETNRFILGDLGIYFRQGDAADLERTLGIAVEDRRALRDQAAAQRAHIVANFSWESVVDAYEGLLRGV